MAGGRAKSAQSEAMREEADRRGGLVALLDGPAAGSWYWADEYLSCAPDSSRRAGYVETSERATNPDTRLRGYGQATIWRFDESLMPSSADLIEVSVPPWKSSPVFCPCGERLLQPRRTQCERCRVGQPPTRQVWLYANHAAMLASREAARQEQVGLDVAALLDDDGELDPVPIPPGPAPTPEPSTSQQTEETAAWVWSQLARHYDR